MEANKIPTAEEFIQNTLYKHELETGVGVSNLKEYLIEFAKLHVAQALEAAAEKTKQFPIKISEMDIVKQSILNSYNYDNIK